MGVKIYRNGAWEEIASKNSKSEIKYVGSAAENIFSSIITFDERWKMYSNRNSYLYISADRTILGFHMGILPCQSDMTVSASAPYVCHFKSSLGGVVSDKIDLSYNTYKNIQKVIVSSSDIKVRGLENPTSLVGGDPFYVDCIVLAPNSFLFKDIPEIYNIW